MIIQGHPGEATGFASTGVGMKGTGADKTFEGGSVTVAVNCIPNTPSMEPERPSKGRGETRKREGLERQRADTGLPFQNCARRVRTQRVGRSERGQGGRRR